MLKSAKYLTLLLLLGLASLPATAQMQPGRHPGYLHALSDIRTARWLLTRQPGDRKVYEDETLAIEEIDAAIGELKRAAIDDGKNLNDHQPVDAKEHGSRLLRAMEALDRAHADINQEEDNPQDRGWRRAASEHVERARKAAGRAHAAWLQDNGK